MKNILNTALFKIRHVSASFLAFLLITAVLPQEANAQYSMLTDFAENFAINGADPDRGQNVISDGIFLYGMTSKGGSSGDGTIFKVMPDGTGFVKLYDFNHSVSGGGYDPAGSLFYYGNFLYGMTRKGGENSGGSIFKIKTDGTGYTKLFDFKTVNGVEPCGTLISDGIFLFGMTLRGGTKDSGIVFKIMPDGTGFTKLHDFSEADLATTPLASLLLLGDALYGTTKFGGVNNKGAVFKILTDGTGFTVLTNFTYNKEYNPESSLIYDGTFLYGMTGGVGSTSTGTIFKIRPDGSGFLEIFGFAGYSDGTNPSGSLTSDGTYLYGMTTGGGASGLGMLFKISPDGTGFTKLLDFEREIHGAYPRGSLFFDGNFLYGMASSGGTHGLGTLFKVKTDGTAFEDLLNFGYKPNGSNPHYATLFNDGTFLYGMTKSGGKNNIGAIFKIMKDGTNLTTLFDFSGEANGASPKGALIANGKFLYGMTSRGGKNDKGTIFKLMPDGTGFSKLFDFDGFTTGEEPSGSLLSDGTYLYGMTRWGGKTGIGNIFKIKFDGTEFSKLLEFDTTTNGACPNGTLITDGTFLYGTANMGGTKEMGTLFKIMPDGTGFVKLLDFVGATNGNGPSGSLIVDGNFLYGTAWLGGADNKGTLFKIKTDGTGFKKLLDFKGVTNGDGPYTSPIVKGTFLYGMTRDGGKNNSGTIYKIKTDGTAFSKLFDFDYNVSGLFPNGGLIADDAFLYGTTLNGGSQGLGTVFKYQYTDPNSVPEISQDADNTNQISVFPNPNAGAFTVHSTYEGKYTITNQLGQVVKSFTLNAGNKNSVNVENLSKGVYFLIGPDTKKLITQKIVVTK